MPKEHEIIEKRTLAEKVTLMRLYEPEIAAKRKAGQFLVVLPRPTGERIPLTIADSDSSTVTIVFQTAGASTAYMERLGVGDCFEGVVGPLGSPTHIENFGRVVCVGGGIGVAVVLPIAAAMKKAGAHVTSIIGARRSDLIILEEETRQASDVLHIATDDGSRGFHGLVTQLLKNLIDEGIAGNDPFKVCLTIGPVPMMRATCQTTLPYQLKTLASLNPIMVDATGMCGACRVTVHGEVKFVCIHGPEFDGHGVDFDELIKRLAAYREFEKTAMDKYLAEQARTNAQHPAHQEAACGCSH